MTARRQTAVRAVFDLEARKLVRAPVARVATVASLALVAATTVGGYAAARSSPGTDIGRKAAAMVTEPGWAGYLGLATTSVGVTTLLAVGVVMAWVVGREFTDGTIVGLFAIPPSRKTIATAKIVAVLTWVAGLALADAAIVGLGGVALGLPAAGVPSGVATILTVAGLLGAAALPVMWVATVGRGYLAGIAATLALVVVTNVAAGFGLGPLLPWAVPVLWATPGAAVPASLLALPVVVAVAGAWGTRRAWRDLRLGVS